MTITSTTIGTISGGAPTIGYVGGLLSAQQAGAHISIKSAAPYLDVERNKLLWDFIDNSTDDFIVFVDDDIHFNAQDIAYVTSHDPTKFPVVSGLYANNWGEGLGIQALALRYRWDDHQQVMKHCVMTREELWACPRIGDHLIEVDGCGAGFLAIHRSLLLSMREIHGKHYAWFIEMVYNDAWTGEDLMFCHRVKAMGLPVMIDTRPTLTHEKTVHYRCILPAQNESV